MKKETDSEDWDLVIKPKGRIFNLNFREIWRYRDLILLFVKRDFVSNYKQTILGPVWFFVQPIITAISLTIVFGNIANLDTQGINKPLFYFSGVLIWGFFTSSLLKTSGTLVSNASIFGKVYFPRLTSPLSMIISNFIAFTLQFLIFLILYIIYSVKTGVPHFQFAHLPGILFIILVNSGLGLGIGLLFSAISTKYRDFNFVLGYVIQLGMYCSTLLFSSKNIKVFNNETGDAIFRTLLMLNPVSSLINYFRYIFFGIGELNVFYLGYSAVFAMVVMYTGIVVFNKVERNFIDTV